MGQGRFGHDRILSGVIVCHVVGNNGVFPERGSRGPCVGFWVPGSIWQRMWYFCAKFQWIKGVFYHGLCVIIYAGRIVPCLHWYLIRVIGRMTSLEWFSIWETSNNIINFNDVRKRLWKLVSMMMFSPCVFCVLADQLRLLQFPQPGAHQHRPHTEDAVTPTNSLHQEDRPASLANPTGTRRGDSVIMTLFSRGVPAGQKRQPNNTVGAAAVHPDDELPTERWTHEKI